MVLFYGLGLENFLLLFVIWKGGLEVLLDRFLVFWLRVSVEVLLDFR